MLLAVTEVQSMVHPDLDSLCTTIRHLQHFPSVKTRFYCPWACLSLNPQCRDDVFESE